MQLREDIKKFGRRIHEKNLTIGRAGNLSVKLDPDTFLINRAGADLSTLEEDELIFCNISMDRWRGGYRPSIEYGFHLLFRRPNTLRFVRRINGLRR
jgi:ribulose-5-phosphate 4-epimerase/fuculose-1-phosphate aldolase